MCMVFAAIFPLPAAAAGTHWVSGQNGTKLQSEDDTVTGWIHAGRKWYYASESGYIVKGWQIIDGNTYYFSDNGQMQTGMLKLKKDGKDGTYLFDSSGKMHTGWKKEDGKWYFFGSDGAMKTGWLETSGKKYYFKEDGSAAAGETAVDGKIYVFSSSGELQENNTEETGLAAADGTDIQAAGENGGNYYQLGDAFAVLHADDDGNINKVKTAVGRGFYAVEADVQLKNGTLYCYHTNYNSGASPTLLETYNAAKEYGAKIVMDLKDTETDTLQAIADFVSSYEAYDNVIIQTNSKGVMQKLNSLTGRTLIYWGLVMSSSSTISDLISNASSYQSLGMKAVNIPKTAGSWRLGNEENIRKLENAGYEICVFTWGKFSDSEISTYCSYGASYLMTNSADN